VLLGTGDGTFQPEIRLAAPFNPGQVTAGDFNSDGHLDLVVAAYATNDLVFFAGQGEGHFQPSAVFNLGPQPSLPISGDFNADGKLDLAGVARLPDQSLAMSVLPGNG